MEHFAGLDVSVNKTSVCIVDDAGRMVPLDSRGHSSMRTAPDLT